MSINRLSLVAAMLAVALACTLAQAVNIETVPVGNPGNAGELSGAGAGGLGRDRICGAVSYDYRIGKYEVTAGKYTEFLNAVARTDSYGLYNTNMDVMVNKFGCNIKRSGSPGSHTYSVMADWANWLHNGQPMGAQGLATTEEGAYHLNGATSDAVLMAVTRKASATWVIPSEDEWYKAAYYKGGSTNAGYWDYPTRNNTAPGQDMADASGNNANYDTAPYAFPIDSPYYTTVAGEFQNSASPYGTFDQGGNMWEWNEAAPYNSSRAMRGGSYLPYDNKLLASYRNGDSFPSHENIHIGFRVAYIPEPASVILLMGGSLSLVGRHLRRRQPDGRLFGGASPRRRD
jgi:formylglycine-generating enzyme required for sulfatase activity